MASGFARFRCTGCAREILVAFSCKGRGFCPSCCGRRMAALAAHLVDDVLGDLPVRQWVLTLPHRLRYALAYDPSLCRAVLEVFVRALLGFERRRARREGLVVRGGAVTAIQRCCSALNTNIHFHTLVAEGVFVTRPDGAVCFVPAGRPPTDLEVGGLLVTVRRRILCLVRRHGIAQEAEPRRPWPATAWRWRSRRWRQSPARRCSAGWPPGRAPASGCCGSARTPRRRWSPPLAASQLLAI